MRFLLFAHYGTVFFMHNNEFIQFFRKFALLSVGVLPVVFWFSLIFSFDTPAVAVSTLIAVAIHECGHFLTIIFLGKKIEGFRGTLSGLRIKRGYVSYGSEFLIYLGGPLANAAAALIASFFLSFEYAKALFAVNFATCISNLLPAEGYDGYGMLRCLLTRRGVSRFHDRVLGCISLLTVTLLCTLSLYMMDRCGEGYWIFFVFFISMLKKMENSPEDAKNEE